MPAFFGRETRYVMGLYLQRAFIFTAVALAVVLALDVASNLGAVMSPDDHPSGLDGPYRLAFYILLRAGYVLPSILPIAGIIGIIWTEFGLFVSLERIMIFNSGRAHLRSLIPAVLVGLIIGLMQFVALGYGRPAAVAAQGTNHFRYYGPKFDQPTVTGPKWIATDGAAVNARVEIDAGITLRDVIVYNFNDGGKLRSIISASFAAPGPTHGTWTFHNGSEWAFAAEAANAVDPGRLEQTRFDALSGKLALDPVWVENFAIRPPLLSQSVLAQLASGAPGIPDAFRYQSAYHERFASIVNSVGMALVGAALSLLTFAPKMSPFQALKVAVYGTGTYIGSNMLAMFGTYGNLHVFWAAWAMPLFIAIVSVCVVYLNNRRVVSAIRLARQLQSG